MMKLGMEFWVFILAIAVELTGIVLLFMYDWKIGLLVFLIHWTGNIQNHIKRKEMISRPFRYGEVV